MSNPDRRERPDRPDYPPPRSGAKLLTPTQLELLEQIAEAGTLAHSMTKTQTAGALLGKRFIVPSPDGRGVCLTSEGREVYESVLRDRLARLDH